MSTPSRSTATSKPQRCICTSWSISTSPVARISPWKPRRLRSRRAWLKARPSVNLGKLRSMRCTPVRSSVKGSASLAGAMMVCWPSAGLWCSWAAMIFMGISCGSHLGSGGRLLGVLGGVAGGIAGGLERVDAHAAHGGDEGLETAAFALALLAVGGQQGLDHAGHFGGAERGADDLAGRGRAGQVGAVGAAQRDLVPLLAVLVHAQDADVAAVVVAAAVDAAADVQVDLAQVPQLVQVLVALGDGLGNGQGACIGQRSEERRVGKECRSRWSPY